MTQPLDPLSSSSGSDKEASGSDEAKWLRTGDHFHGYAILKEIGHGGMARIFAARDSELGRIIALKVLDPDLAKQEKLRLRFLAEGQFGERLEHSAIPMIYDIGHWGGFDYIAMEYVRGRNLQRMLGNPESRLFTPRLSARIIQTVAEALSHAYGRGLVHRDIKLDNIMIDADKAIKLMDFGLALDMRNDRADATSKLGSPNYISPEQARGLAVDFRTDIYSLGVCFYYMVTGRFPFIARDSAALIKMHLERQPRPPIEINPALSEAANRLILRMLAKDRDERHHAYPALLNQLDKVIAGQEPLPAEQSSRQPAAAPEASKPIKESKAPQADQGRHTIEIDGRAIEQISHLDAISIADSSNSASSDALSIAEAARAATEKLAQSDGATTEKPEAEAVKGSTASLRGARPGRASAPDPRVTRYVPEDFPAPAEPVTTETAAAQPQPQEPDSHQHRDSDDDDVAKKPRIQRPGKSHPSSQRLPSAPEVEAPQETEQPPPSTQQHRTEKDASESSGSARRNRPGRPRPSR